MAWKRFRYGIVLMLAAPTACGGDLTPSVHQAGPSPVAPTPTPAQPLPTTARVTITGVVNLTMIGETSQLIGTASRSDGTTKDVTNEGQWSISGDTRIATISPTGLLTIVSFGRTTVFLKYETAAGAANVTATPAGTFIISGRVREPGMAGLADVRITEMVTASTKTSDKDGQFSFANMKAGTARMRYEKDGFETVDDQTTIGQQSSIDMPLQRIIRLSPGQTVTPSPLAPNDLAYTIDGKVCDPCRRIRINVPRAGTLNVQASWQSAPMRLTLLYGGQSYTTDSTTLSADVPVTSAGEIVAYLGNVGTRYNSGHAPFTITASMK